MSRIQCFHADITTLDVGAIVNAANTSLLGGGGVDGAIHRAGGPAILEQCRAIVARQGGCAPGDAVITTGGRLKAKHVIHTVGPVWTGDPAKEVILAKAYRSSLQLATSNGVNSIAFPNISTGIYRFPKLLAAEIAIREVSEFLKNDNMLKTVIFCCFDKENESIYLKLLSTDITKL